MNTTPRQGFWLTPPVFDSILNPMEINRNPPLITVCLLATVALFTLSCESRESPKRYLKRLDLEYRTDSEGDYRITIPLPDGEEKEVGIGARGIPLRDGQMIREIWSVAARIPGGLPEGLAESLLTDTWSSAMLGSWALAGVTDDGRHVLVYLTRLPMDASLSAFSSALKDAAAAASDMEKALASLTE